MESKLHYGDTRDDHPGLVFAGYKRGKEQWRTPERLADLRDKHRIRENRRRENNPRLRELAVAYAKKFRLRPEYAERVPQYRNKQKAKWRDPVKGEILRARAREKRKSEAALIYQRRYMKERSKRDANYKLMRAYRCRVYNALRSRNVVKRHSTEELIGCPIPAFKTWIQSQFLPGMDWNNFGQWHIDHIKPLAAFDLTDPKQAKKAFNYQNCMPLWAIDNLRKSDRLDGHLFRARELT